MKNPSTQTSAFEGFITSIPKWRILLAEGLHGPHLRTSITLDQDPILGVDPSPGPTLPFPGLELDHGLEVMAGVVQEILEILFM